jgi:RNA polymerase sigma factor (sigma-70 family)
MMYDKYAAALYGYCHWMLHDSADSAGALQSTFVIAATTLGDLSEPSKLRPWLFALARNECRRRIRPASAACDEETDAVGQLSDATRVASDGVCEASDAATATQFRVVTQPANGRAQVDGDRGEAELRTLIWSILAGLKPCEREVIELSSRHDLYDDELAIALGVSRSRAHAQAVSARSRLEEALCALHIALTRRKACPVLGELLANWDGQLTDETRDLVVRHIEECQACSHHRWGALRAASFSRLLPLTPLPPELRERVLSCCLSTAEDAVAYRHRVTQRAESTWFTAFTSAIRHLSWASIRANPGMAIAAAAVALWAVAAVSITLLTFARSHAAHAQAPRPAGRSSARAYAPRTSAGTSPRSPAAAQATTAATSAAARPSPTYTQPSVYVSSPFQPPPSPGTSKSSSPEPSISPKPSESPSLSSTTPPSPSSTTSPSSSASATP